MPHDGRPDAPAGSPRIVVMAKKPALGMVKTRLTTRLSERDTLRLYEAFLADKVDQVRGVRGARAVVSVAPPDAPDSIRPWIPADVDVVAQRGPDLGARLAALMADHFDQSSAPLLLVDSDTPTLPPAVFSEAIDVLGRRAADVVVGPSVDGGYYLIGLSAACPALFEGIAWSTSRVLSQTRERAARAGLTVHDLVTWRDVDTPEDFDALVRELSALARTDDGFPERTARAIADLESLRRER